MNFGDKKKVLIAGGIAIVAILLLVVFATRGKKAPAGVGAGSARAGAATRAGQGSGGQTAQGGGATPAPGQVGAGGAGEGAGAAAEGEQAAGAARLFGSVGIGTGQMSTLTRPDPLILLEPPPPVITPEEKTPLPSVVTVAGGLRPLGALTGGITETIADRRVAGVKFNGGVWAILERGGQTFVVKPGDVIEGTKITSISRDSIYVTDPDGQRWQVPLRGAGPGGAAPVTMGRVPGLPEGPAEQF